MVLFGTLGNNTTPLYGGGQVRNPANVLVLTAAPSANAVGNPVGTIAVNRTTGTAYMAVLNTGLSGSVTWAVLGGAAADVNTINSNAPIAGNYTLAGTANQITVAQTAGTSTWSIPVAFTAPGSITSTTTIASGTTMTAGTGFTATTGNIVASAGNITATLGSISAATSVTAASFVTSSATVGLTLSDTGLVPTGSNANIDLAIAGKGTGGVIQSRGVVGGDLTIENTNTDNTNGASRAGVELAVGGASSGDPYVNFLVSGAGVYTMGIDNSVSDNFVISANAALGTSNIASWTSAGALTNTAGITATTGNIAATAGTVSGLEGNFSGMNVTFTSSPVLQSALTTGVAPTGATGDVNLMAIEKGVIMEQFILGGGQTIIAPRMSATGLLTSLDLTNTEGAEYNFGAVRSNSPFAYTIGTSAAFFIELAVNAADVGGLDPFSVGFRKAQANDATFTNYTDFATIGARATTAADVCVIQTDLNNGGEVITNTTDAWTDGQTKTFKVLVSAAGVVTYTINGIAPTVTAAFTFDTADVVVPFIRHIFGAATPGAINWVSLRIGFQ